MKNLIFAFVFVVCLATLSSAQGTLQFNRVLIISNAQTTVPTSKVWKVTSVYGTEFTLNQCISTDASFDYLGLKCVSDFANNQRSIKLSFFSAQISVNGSTIVHSLSGIPAATSITRYTDLNCTSAASGIPGWDCANRAANPNLLPLWLPAGTTLKTGGPSTFLSVI